MCKLSALLKNKALIVIFFIQMNHISLEFVEIKFEFVEKKEAEKNDDKQKYLLATKKNNVLT